jgi:secondary thiamine-phosphate synthase enzyme
MPELKLHTDSLIAFVDITREIHAAVSKSKTRDGLCNLFVPHTTAAIVVSENWDPDVVTDMTMQLERMVPREGGYRHDERNSQSHILSVMLSTSINVPVRDGKLALGRWQGVMFAEFDGPRDRSLMVTVIGA